MRTVDVAGGFPIMEEDMFTYETFPERDPEFALVYEAAMRLVAGGASPEWAVRTSMKVLNLVDKEFADNGEQETA